MSSKIIAELERLFVHYGRKLTPDEVVDEARPQTSPLHDRFDWDDTAAAESWRRQQARQLLEIKVEHRMPTGEIRMIPFAVSAPDDRENGDGYRRTLAVMSDTDVALSVAIERTQRAMGVLRNFPHPLTDAGLAELERLIKPHL